MKKQLTKVFSIVLVIAMVLSQTALMSYAIEEDSSTGAIMEKFASSNVSYSYYYMDDGVVISYASLWSYEGDVLDVPSSLDGYAVVGIDYLEWSTSVKEIIVPDSVKFLGENWIPEENTIKTITLGKSVGYIDAAMFSNAKYLEKINVSSENEAYASIDGVVYDKQLTTLTIYPLAKTGEVILPETIEDITLLDNEEYLALTDIKYADGTYVFNVVDGIKYSQDMTKILGCSSEKTGSYVMPETVTELGPKAFANTNFESIEISPNVQHIVYAAFADCTSLKSVTIPSSVKTIELQAFGNCSALESISIPDSVTTIGKQVFMNCSGMKTATLGTGVEEIGLMTFSDCTSLEKVNIPDKVSILEEQMFYNCNSLTDVTLGKGLTLIDYAAFKKCTALKKIVVPSAVAKIGSYAFSDCTSLSDVTLKRGLKTIGYSAFYNCTSLKKLVLPDGLTTIESSVFCNCTSLADINIPDSITVINYSVFENCTSLQKIVIPNSVIRIYDRAFYKSGLTNVTIPYSVNGIAESAFAGCSNLKKAVVSKGVKAIGYNAFAYCPKLTSISLPKSLIYLAKQAFVNTGYANNSANWKNGVLYIDSAIVETKTNVSGHCNIKDGTTIMAEEVFRDRTELTGVTIPYGVENIPVYAFNGCTKLSKANISDSVKNIDSTAFTNTALTSIKIPSSVESMDLTYFEGNNEQIEFAKEYYSVYELVYSGGAFSNTKISKIVMPETLVSMRADTFRDTPWWDAQPDGIVYLGKMANAYKGKAPKNTTIEIKEGTLGISAYAFTEQPNIVAVTLPKSLREIGYYAFSESGLSTITIPAGVSSIGSTAFVACNNWESITIKGYSGTYAETFANNRGYDFESIGKIPTTAKGLYKVGGVWCYVKNGKVDYSYTGLCKYNDVWYYVEDGVKDTTYTGLVKYSDKWYYVNDGKVDKSFTGLFKYSGKWYYVNKGVVDKTYTGLVKHTDGKWYYVKSGVKTSFNGLVKYNGKWYHIKDGVKTTYTGLVKHTDGKWYYVKSGVKTSFNGLVKYNDKWYHVKDGVKTTYTGLVKHTDGKWYYVKNGVKTTYTGNVKYNGKTYKVKNGVKV